jgi:acetoin utilization deacetylase AcuC-like enzyme
MSTVLFTHPACLDHDTGDYHPECADRLRAVMAALEGEEFANLYREEAPLATSEQILRVHSRDYLELVGDNAPAAGQLYHLDPDTVLSGGSWEAALRAAGAVVAGVDGVLDGSYRNVFCAVRPPGHHAGAGFGMGFCVFNNVAIGALQARVVHGVERIAAIDLDVHHGNGTQDIFFADSGLFYASIHQSGAFPGTGLAGETGVAGNILNIPMPAGTASGPWRAAVDEVILPRLRAFAPQLILVSMGFDAHAADPMAHMRLTTADYHWVTNRLCEIAAERCANRLVSVLEGGYDLRALAMSSAAHVRALMGF